MRRHTGTSLLAALFFFLSFSSVHSALPAPTNVRCTASNSHGVRVEWEPLSSNQADAYAVTAAAVQEKEEEEETVEKPPVALVTVEGGNSSAATLLDLRAGRTYAISVRAHPAEALTLAWAWDEAEVSTSILCKTTKANPALRLGFSSDVTGPESHAVSLALPEGADKALSLFVLALGPRAGSAVGLPLKALLAHDGPTFARLAVATLANSRVLSGWQHVPLVKGETRVRVGGLEPGNAYAAIAAAACVNSSGASGPQNCIEVSGPAVASCKRSMGGSRRVPNLLVSHQCSTVGSQRLMAVPRVRWATPFWCTRLQIRRATPPYIGFRNIRLTLTSLPITTPLTSIPWEHTLCMARP